MIDDSILHYLVRVGVMDDGHKTSGMTYLDWQEAYRAETGARTMKFDERSNAGRAEDKASKYIHLVRNLGHHHQRRIETALYMHPVPPSGRGALYGDRDTFLEAFERLGWQIRATNERVKAGEENSKTA